MPYSALALGQADLRLRSGRSRTDRSHRLSVRLAVLLITAVGLVGLGGAGIQARSASAVDSSHVDQQRYLQALWPISTDLEQTTNRVGLAAALYENDDIDRVELAARLQVALDNYARDADQLESLDPPAELVSVQQGYVAALATVEQATLEMLKTSDDGDDAHLATAVPPMLEAFAVMRDLADRFWPARVG